MTSEDSKRRTERRKRAKEGNSMVLANLPIPDREAWIAILKSTGLIAKKGSCSQRAIAEATAQLIAGQCRGMRQHLDSVRPEKPKHPPMKRVGALERESMMWRAMPFVPESELIKRPIDAHDDAPPKHDEDSPAPAEDWFIDSERGKVFDWDRAVKETGLGFLEGQGSLPTEFQKPNYYKKHKR